MVDKEKLKDELRKKFGDKLEEKIKQKQKERNDCSEVLALHYLANELDDVVVPVSTVIGQFKVFTIEQIKEKVLDKVDEFEQANIKDANVINTEMKGITNWVGVISVCTGISTKITSYVTQEKIADIQQKIGFVDPTGYIEGVIWKKETIDRIKEELESGRIYGLGGMTTTYYHQHKKVGLSLSKATQVQEIVDKVHQGWLRDIEDIEEFDGGFVKISDVGAATVRKWRGCGNPNCSDSYSGTNAQVCRTCAQETVELLSHVYPAVCCDDLSDFQIPAWIDLKLEKGVEYIVAIRRMDNNGEKQFTILAILNMDDYTDEVTEEFYHGSEDASVATPQKVAKEVKKIDTSKVEVSKKDVVRIKNMMNTVTTLMETELSSITKTLGFEDNPEIVVKGLEVLVEDGTLVLEGSTWKLKSS